MDINNSSEVTKIIVQGAFKASEVSSETLRKKRRKENQNLSLSHSKGHHAEVNIISPTDEIKDNDFHFFTVSKVKDNGDEKDLSDSCDIDLHDPKIGKNVDIER
ncbi:hypothetical protein [Borrelia persica]|uniref:hypothetical protein n=1 Tax=Borrelia persica TaxID=44448 RepID=UPI000464A22F|nr:hypothetical protein [Borrelia persica]